MPRKSWSGVCFAAELQEQAFAAADFDFQRQILWEESRRVPGLRHIVDRLEMKAQVERGIGFSKCAARHEWSMLRRDAGSYLRLLY